MWRGCEMVEWYGVVSRGRQTPVLGVRVCSDDGIGA